jgi:hypothetical protein
MGGQVSLLHLRSLCYLFILYGFSGTICVPLSLTVYSEMNDVDCKVECRSCKKVFIVPSIDHPVPAHDSEGKPCPGSNDVGIFLSLHNSTTQEA